MEHNISLITMLAGGFGLALIFGFIAEKLKLPALVGYLLAGIALGPATPGMVADMELAPQLLDVLCIEAAFHKPGHQKLRR